MKRYSSGLILVLVLSGAIGCAGNLSNIATVAKVSGEVEQSGLLVLHTAQAAYSTVNPKTNAPLISKRQLDYVAFQCDKLGRLGSQLGQLLYAYQSAKAAGQDTAQLAASIQAIVASATNALGLIGTAVPKGTVQSIDQAVSAALGFYAQVRATAL